VCHFDVSYSCVRAHIAGARQHVERLRYFYEKALVDAAVPTSTGGGGELTAVVSREKKDTLFSLLGLESYNIGCLLIFHGRIAI